MISKKEFYTQGNACPVRVVLYDNPDIVPKACILYFHGGGLLYGHSDDLPRTHLERLTSAGYPVASFEYPLAPAADLRMILSSVTYSINHYLCHPEQYVSHKLPYVLFGRSAGAYLCLIAAAHGVLAEKPAGILSYYGYGFLCDNWFETKSSYYASLPRGIGELSESHSIRNPHIRRSGYPLQRLCIRPPDREMEIPDLQRPGKIFLSRLLSADVRFPAVSAVCCPLHRRSGRTVCGVSGALR